MKKQVWKRLWARKYSPLISSFFIECFQKHRGFNMCKNKLFVPEGNLYAIYFSDEEFQKLVKTYTRLLMRQNLSRYAIIYEKQFKNFLNWSKIIKRRNFAKFTNTELAELLLELKNRMVEFSEWQFLAFVVSEGPAVTVEQKLIKEDGGSTILEAIASPYKLTKITKARLELLRLKKFKKATRKNLEHYVKKYAWISVYEFIDKPWTIKDIYKQIKSIKDAVFELDNYNLNKKLADRRYKNYLKAIKDSNWKKLVEIVHYFSYLKEMRDDYRRYAYYLLRPFWQEIAKRTGISFEDTNYLTTKELLEALRRDGKRFLNIIKARKKKYAIVLREGKLRVYSGIIQAKKIAKVVEAGVSTNKVEGTCAMRGMVRGRVRIIFHVEEFNEFKPGEILVTTMTHPEFLMIMKQAKAIITDEGGITCHAAIVSRELGIPCIIGTKIATKVLKDGDLVEVDADKGVVRILKK